MIVERCEIKSPENGIPHSYKTYRQDVRSVIYLGEIYPHSSCTTPHEWTDVSATGAEALISRGRRFIFVHVGDELKLSKLQFVWSSEIVEIISSFIILLLIHQISLAMFALSWIFPFTEGEACCVPNALLIFKSGVKTGNSRRNERTKFCLVF
jgi:hypothetical protein